MMMLMMIHNLDDADGHGATGPIFLAVEMTVMMMVPQHGD